MGRGLTLGLFQRGPYRHLSIMHPLPQIWQMLHDVTGAVRLREVLVTLDAL